MIKPFSTSLILLLAVPLHAQVKPGDSVDSGRWRRSSHTPAPTTTGEFFPIFENINLGSQLPDGAFVEYGPFTNRSSSMLRISLRRTGTTGRNGLYATRSGVHVADNPDYIEFTVSPNQLYKFAAKDYAWVSAASMRPGESATSVGLPEPSEFVHPTGDYTGCVNTEVRVAYFYKPGSLSDHSYRKDEAAENGVLIGPKPPGVPDCPPTLVPDGG